MRTENKAAAARRAACTFLVAMTLAACGSNGISARHSVPSPTGTGSGTIFSWTENQPPLLQDSGVKLELNNVAFGGSGAGLFVVVGTAGTILTSTDAVHWTSRQSGTEVDLYGVTYGNGQFIAVGGEDVNGVGVVLNSTDDGATWTTDESFDGGPLSGVNFANDQFVAVGAAQVVSSPDGINWDGPDDSTTGITSDTVDLFNTTFGNDLYVTAGTYNETNSKSDVPYEGLIATSSDASTWNVLPYFDDYLSGITFGGGKFVAVGRGGLILTSSDGTSWAEQSVPALDATKTPYLISVVYSGTQYVATGNYVGVNPSTGFLLTSPDAVTWTMQETGANVYGVAFGKAAGVGTYVAVGGQ